MGFLVSGAESSTLEQQIEESVSRRTAGSIRQLRVDVQNERVVLSGSASTYYAKQLATHAALEAGRDLQLTNSIEVI